MSNPDEKKRILVITQKVSSEDPVLGFFHGWLSEISRRFEVVTVICLEKGQYRLPQNTTVFSLGKERGVKRSGYIKNFYRVIWRERKNYDAVFVHMNAEYVLLGGLIWFFLRKPVFLWYNHSAGDLYIRLARFFTRRIFHTSDFAYPARFRNAMKMPAGINVEQFKPQDVLRKQNAILSLGRIAPIKRVHIVIKAAQVLHDRKTNFSLSIYGDALPKDKLYYEELHRRAKTLVSEGKVTFRDGIPNYKAPSVYSAHDVFVNLSPDGLFDKTILEAAACETVPLASSKAFKEVLPPECFVEAEPQALAERVRSIFSMSESGRAELGRLLRQFVVREHSLTALMDKMAHEVEKSL